MRDTVSGLTDAERSALADRAREYGLELAPDATVFVTESSRSRTVLGVRRQPKQVRTALCVTSRALLIAITSEGATSVLHARPAALKVSDSRLLEDPRLAARLPASAVDGIGITGFATHVDGVATTASYHLGLGAPDGEAARELVTACLSSSGPSA